MLHIYATSALVGELIGTANENKDGLMSKKLYSSKFRYKEVGNNKVVAFNVPRYTRGALKLYAVSTQNIIFFKEFAFIVDMNIGKPKAYGIDSESIKYKIGSQSATIYMKLSSSSSVNVYLQYAEVLTDNLISDIDILDDFPSDAISF